MVIFCLTKMAAVAVLLGTALPADARSVFGFPGQATGSGNFPVFAGLDGHRYGGHRQDYYRQPCPQYRPMQVSDWQPVTRGSVSGHTLQAVLPGVRASDRRTQLSADGRNLEFFGFRQVPARGRACLPRGSHLSDDGRYEILEASVALPEGSDVSRASVRQAREGVEVVVPRRPFRAPQVPEQSRPEVMPRSRTIQVVPSPPPRPKVVLPPSDGVEVIEEDFPEPEKMPDACSGWRDNRGEFHAY